MYLKVRTEKIFRKIFKRYLEKEVSRKPGLLGSVLKYWSFNSSID